MTLQRARTDFWGTGPARRETADFSFHLLAANPPEDEVQTHMHEEAHFVLALSGSYMSSLPQRLRHHARRMAQAHQCFIDTIGVADFAAYWSPLHSTGMS